MILKGEGESADRIVGGAEWSTLTLLRPRR